MSDLQYRPKGAKKGEKKRKKSHIILNRKKRKDSRKLLWCLVNGGKETSHFYGTPLPAKVVLAPPSLALVRRRAVSR